MPRDARRKRILQISDQGGNDVGSRFHAAQDRHILLPRHFQTLLGRLNVARKDQRRNLIGEQLVENFALALRGKRVHIRRLDIADHL